MRSLFRAGIAALVIAALAAPIVAPTAAFAQSNDGRNRRVLVRNQTNMTIWEFYASTPNRGWQEDILGGDIISRYGNQRMTLDDGSGSCIYDIKVVFNNRGGAYLTRFGVNICTTYYIDVYSNRIGID